MDSQNLTPNTPDELKYPGIKFQHQYLLDLTLIHEKFVDLWFKHINYFEASLGQLPTENLRFIDGLNFVECCFLQREMNMMADEVAEFLEHNANKPRDFYTEEFDMKAQISAYMNYIDQRITTLHHLHGLMEESRSLSDFYVFIGEVAHE